MKVPYEWLATFFEDGALPPIEDVAEKLIFHAYEVESVENGVLDIDVLPNRAADSLSVRGIAREVSTLFDIPMKRDPLDECVTLEPKTDIPVSIDAGASCSYYIAARIEGVAVGESPAWLKERLAAVGQKSINNVVDATNYVLFELGRPTHVFDADKMNGVRVRRAHEGESITLLGGETVSIPSVATVIADSKSDAALAIGGIKGGAHAEVDANTANIIIECANFDPTQTRISAQALKLRTDASARFENNMADMLADYGAREVVDLIVDIAGGTLRGFATAGSAHDHRREISISTERVNALLGTRITSADMQRILERIGCSVSSDGDMLTVMPPRERRDITIPEDIIEEIGRVHGYNNVTSVQLSPAIRTPEINAHYAASEYIRDILTRLGFVEVYLYSLRDSGDIRLRNALASDKDHLRKDLASGLLEALERNARNAPLFGMYEDIRLFEIGNVFTKHGEETHVCIGARALGKKDTAPDAVKKARDALSEVFRELPECSGSVYEFILPPFEADVYPQLPTVGAMTYTPFSTYPFVTRDIALWVPEAVSHEEVAQLVREHAGEWLVRIDLFDTFAKDGRVSYAWHLVFQSPEKTLTDGEVNECMHRVEQALQQRGFEVR